MLETLLPLVLPVALVALVAMIAWRLWLCRRERQANDASVQRGGGNGEER